MALSTRLSNGWNIAKVCYKMLRAHKQLILFPILSTISLLFVLASFVIYSAFNSDYLDSLSRSAIYMLFFLGYLIAYFIIVFFNMALVHCARLHFEGKDVSIEVGLRFSLSRVGTIFSWALFAATVGTILKIAQDNLGFIGRIITGIVGFVWSVSIFFVVPVLAYENLGPADAFKRSATMMRNKWGESIAASFSFGLFQIISGVILLLIVVFAIEISGTLAAILFGIGFALISVISSALQTILTTAVYCNINGEQIPNFNPELMDGLFEEKNNKLF